MDHPKKRHAALKPLNAEHYQSLQLCWKLREARRRGISEGRIKHYLDFFYNNVLDPHLRFEEEEIFILMGEDHPLVKRAMIEHRRLRQLFSRKTNLRRIFAEIEEELEENVSFEEHVLFNEVQENTSEEELLALKEKELSIKLIDPEDWADKFWTNQNVSITSSFV